MNLFSLSCMFCSVRIIRGGGGHLPPIDPRHVDRGGEENEHSQRQANLDQFEEALNSKRWEGYLLMVDIVSFLILFLSGWFDGCPCHHKRPTVDEVADRRTRRNYWSKKEASPCIMSCSFIYSWNVV